MAHVSHSLLALENRLQPLRQRLAEHPLYASIRSLEALHCFMEAHVFAVWDFMSLVKALQGGLTCVDVPWVPTASAEARRLINEIVMGEESDLYDGRAVSHFELYLEAMQACGADTQSILQVIEAIRQGAPAKSAIASSTASASARAFSQATFALIEEQQLHTIASAFTFGREDLIPDMFRGFVRDLDQAMAGRLEVFIWYLERHIEVDGEEHGPMALRMVSALCGEDARLWQEATDAAEAALQARLALWDGILEKIATKNPTSQTQDVGQLIMASSSAFYLKA